MKLDSLKLQNEIARRQLTITDFAQNAKMSTATVYRILRGGRANTKTLGKIAAALSIDKPSELLQSYILR